MTTPATLAQLNPPTPSEAFKLDVDTEVTRLRVRDTARTIFTAEKAAQVAVEPFDAGTLGEILARPPEPPQRCEGLIPSDAGTLIVAMRKTGKTTLTLNLARSLITGEPFLGRFETRPISGTVALLNFEVSASQLARWADDVHIDRDRLYLVNLRGRRNPFTNDDDRQRLAADLRSRAVESLLVDPFGRAYTGTSQNDPGEVGSWLADLDRFARSGVGATDIILSAHAGWEGERTRGSSALEDWADSIITLVRDRDDETQRFMRAIGRDVEVEEDQLVFDPATRLLSMSGAGSRKRASADRKVSELVTDVVAIVIANPGIRASQIADQLRDNGVAFQKGTEAKAALEAVQKGRIWMQTEGRSKLYYPPLETGNPPTSPTRMPPTSPTQGSPENLNPPTSPNNPQPVQPTSPIPPLIGGDGGSRKGTSEATRLTFAEVFNAAPEADQCPICDRATMPSRTGHPSLCRECTLAELGGTAS